MKNYVGHLKEIGTFAFPILCEQAAMTIMSVLVSVMISKISAEAMAGVNLVENLNSLVQNFFLSMEVGAIVVVSQFRGKEDNKGMIETVQQAMLSALAIAAIICTVLAVFNGGVMKLILGNADHLVYDSGYTYFICAVISFPFLAIYAISIAGIRGSGSPKTSLIAVLITNVSFTIFCLFFIFVLNLGVLGAGLALILSRIAGAGCGIYLLKFGSGNLRMDKIFTYKVNWKIQKPILFIGIPAGLENVIFMTGRLMTQTFTVALGTASMTANAASNSIIGFYNIIGNTACSTATPLVGKYLGKKDTKNAKSMILTILGLSIVATTVLSAVMMIFARPIAMLFSESEEIIGLSVNLTMICYIISPIIWNASFIIPAALRAAGDVKFTTITSIVSMLLVRVVMSYVLITVFKLGIQSVWIAMYLDWGVRAVLFTIRCLKGKWLDKKVL